jgi:hypothetical protein
MLSYENSDLIFWAPDSLILEYFGLGIFWAKDIVSQEYLSQGYSELEIFWDRDIFWAADILSYEQFELRVVLGCVQFWGMDSF